jgi:hypothetical protein
MTHDRTVVDHLFGPAADLTFARILASLRSTRLMSLTNGVVFMPCLDWYVNDQRKLPERVRLCPSTHMNHYVSDS